MTPIPYDQDAKRYLNIKIRHVVKTYNDKGELSRKDTLYDVTECSSEFLNKTEYQKQFIENEANANTYCATHPDIFLEGTRGSQYVN